MTMGQKMKQLRQENNLTMEQLATELNKYGAKLSKSKISLLENDKLSLNNRYIDYYVKFFKISYDWLKGKNKFIGQKLMKLRLDNNLKLDELVKIFNEKYNSKIDITTISKLEQNKLNINDKYLRYYADYFGISYEWLKYGDNFNKHIYKNARLENLGLDTLTIPLYENEALIEYITDILVYKSVNIDMVRYKIVLPKIKITSLIAIELTDNTLSPLIKKGSIIIIDLSVVKLKNNDLGVFFYNNTLLFGRITSINNNYIIIPYNSTYLPIKIDNSYIFNVVGKIIKYISEF